MKSGRGFYQTMKILGFLLPKRLSRKNVYLYCAVLYSSTSKCVACTVSQYGKFFRREFQHVPQETHLYRYSYCSVVQCTVLYPYQYTVQSLVFCCGRKCPASPAYDRQKLRLVVQTSAIVGTVHLGTVQYHFVKFFRYFTLWQIDWKQVCGRCLCRYPPV